MLSDSSSRVEPSGGDRGRPIRVLLAVGPALIAVTASAPALGIAIVTLADELGAGQVQLTWISNISVIVTAALLLPVGLAADRFGRGRVLAVGLILFGLAELATGLAGEPGVIIALRAMAGLGAAFVLPTSLAALIAAFPPERRATAIAVWAATVSVSASVAGLASGQLTSAVSWRVMPIVLGVIALLMVVPVWLLVAHRRDPEAAVDPIGALLALIGIGAVVFGVTQAGDAPLADPTVAGPLAIGLVALIAFVWWELRTPTPMLPVRLFADRTLQAGTVLLVLVVGSFAGYTLISVQYLQGVREFSELQTALTFLITEAGVLALTPLLPRLIGRFGVRLIGTLGAGLVALAFLGLAAGAAVESFWPIAVALAVLGSGFALSITPASTLVVSGLPANRLSVASSFNYVTRDVGGAVGTALLSAVLLAVYQRSVAPITAGLPAEAAEQADSGPANALEIAESLGAAGTGLIDAANQGFLDGFRAAALTAAGICAVGALVCALRAPADLTTVHEVDPELANPTTRNPGERSS